MRAYFIADTMQAQNTPCKDMYMHTYNIYIYTARCGAEGDCRHARHLQSSSNDFESSSRESFEKNNQKFLGIQKSLGPLGVGSSVNSRKLEIGRKRTLFLTVGGTYFRGTQTAMVQQLVCPFLTSSHFPVRRCFSCNLRVTLRQLCNTQL